MNAVPTSALVLLGAFVIGVLAGRAERRFVLLLAGVAVAVVASAVLAGVTAVPAGRADEWTRLLTVAVPPLVGFLAGWVCARGSWFTRIVVVAAAAILLASFPYAVAGAAVARLWPA